MLLLKSHPEMALKYQFGTSHEDSLTNSKALIQTEKIKANLEIRAKVSMKKPFFFHNGGTSSESSQGWVLTRRCHPQKTPWLWKSSWGSWEDRMPLFLPSECCLLNEWRFSHQQEEKPSWKIPSSLETTANVVPLAFLNLIFTWFLFSFHPAVGDRGASMWGEWGSPTLF